MNLRICDVSFCFLLFLRINFEKLRVFLFSVWHPDCDDIVTKCFGSSWQTLPLHRPGDKLKRLEHLLRLTTSGCFPIAGHLSLRSLRETPILCVGTKQKPVVSLRCQENTTKAQSKPKCPGFGTYTWPWMIDLGLLVNRAGLSAAFPLSGKGAGDFSSDVMSRIRKNKLVRLLVFGFENFLKF